MLQADILAGLADGWIGWRKVKQPAAWDSLAKPSARARKTASEAGALPVALRSSG